MSLGIFADAKRGLSHRKWLVVPAEMVEKAIEIIDFTPPLAIEKKGTQIESILLGEGPVFVHTSLYTALNLNLPWDIGGFEMIFTLRMKWARS